MFISSEQKVLGDKPTRRDDVAPTETASAPFMEEWNRNVEAINRISEERGTLLYRDPKSPRVAELKERREALERRQDALHSQMVDSTIAEMGGLGQDTKFESYALPGGSNYRELLLTLPEKNKFDPSKVSWKRKRLSATQGTVDLFYDGKSLGNFDDSPRMNAPPFDFRTDEELIDIVRRRYGGARELGIKPLDGGASFRSSHFEEPNILAHVRFNERTDADGKRILFIEEIQSDWHQAGRKRGYETKRLSPERRATLLAERDRLTSEAADIEQSRKAEAVEQGLTGQAYSDYTYGDPGWISRMGRITTINDEIGEYTGRVPDAPFKTTWPELAVKRMIRWAAENGFDRVAWTPGDVQASRYDLSKQVSGITLQKVGEKYRLTAGNRQGAMVINQLVADENEIADYIGKEVAAKFFEGERRQQLDAGQPIMLKDLDLKLGGEGMRAFYDRELVNIANKLGKKFDVKVSTIEMERPAESEGKSRWRDRLGVSRKSDVSQAAHGFSITPDMRRAAMQGQPLFSLARPVATITGTELGADFKGPEDMPALRRAAESWYDENLRGTVAHRPDGTPVQFSRQGRKETTWRKTELILRSVPAIRAIIEKGEEVHRSSDDRQGVKESVYVAAPVEVMGEVHNLVVILHVRNDGTWHYDLGYGRDTESPGVSVPGGPAGLGLSRQPEIETAPDGTLNLFDLGRDFKVAAEPATSGYDRLPPYSFVISKKQWIDIANRVHALAGTILGHRFEINVVDTLDEDGTQGIYVPDEQAIYVSVRASFDALETLGHEAIHALRDVGAITAREWKTLSDWARANHLPTTNIRELYEDRYRRRFDVTPGQLEDLLIEEAVADAFGKFVAGDLRTPKSASARRIFEKLQRFLEAVRRYLTGRGFKSADDIFASIARGDMADRAGRGAARGFELYLREGALESVAGLENVQRPPLTGDPYDVAPTDKAREELADIASNINLDYIAAPADIKQVIADVSEQSAHFIGARRGVITNQQTRELAADLGMTPAELAKRQHGQAFNAENIFAARVLLVKSATRVRELAAKAKRSEKLADLAEFQKAFTRHVAIQEQVSGLAAEAGRALQQFKMMAGDNFYKGAKDLVDIARSKNPDDPFGSRSKFGRDAVLDLAEMVDALDDPAAINRFSRDTFRVTIGNMIREAWINALLSGFRTHATNILSNTLTALWQVPETAIAATIGALHGGEKVQFAEASARLVGLVEGAQEGLRAGATAFRTGEPSDLGSKLETHRIKAIPGIAGEIIRIPSRALLAEDEVFKAVNYRAELNAQAVRIAMAEGRRGESLAERITELKAVPTQAMKAAAHKAALYNTFQSDLGPIGRAVMQMRERIPGAWVVLPFIKTPANIIKYAAERSPFGLMMQEVRDNLDGKNGNIARDTQWARLTLGSSIGITVAMMAGAGIISGGGPDDPEERNLLRARGWQPYSIRIGDTWYSYQRLDPFGFIMGVSSDLVELGEAVTDAEADKVGAMIVSSISGNLLEKTWLRGLGDLLQAVQDPGRYGEYYIRGLAGTLIPTGVAQFAQTNDPVLRDARSIVDVLKSRTPGMTTGLASRRNIFGEEIRREGALGPDLISPIFTSRERNDKAIDAMLELHYAPSMPRREINGHKLNEVQYDEYSELAGKAAKKELDRKVNQSSWDNKSPDLKTKIIKSAFDDARDQARVKMKRKYPDLKKKAKP